MNIQEVIGKINPDNDYSVGELKALFGVSNTAILSAVRRGKLDAKKIFNRYYITGRSVRDYLMGEKKEYNNA